MKLITVLLATVLLAVECSSMGFLTFEKYSDFQFRKLRYYNENDTVPVSDVALPYNNFYLLDYHFRKNLVFVTDTQALFKLPLRNNGQWEKVMQIEGLFRGLAVDWVQDMLYLVNCDLIGDCNITSCDFNGQNATTIIQSGPWLEYIRIDPVNRMFLWFNRDEIQSSSLTGGEFRIVASAAVSHVVFDLDFGKSPVTLDMEAQRIYYTNKSNTLFSIGYHGDDFRQYKQLTGNVRSLWLVGGYMYYWAENLQRSKNFIYRTYLDMNDSNSEMITSFNKNETQVTLVDDSQQKYPCDIIHCSHYCHVESSGAVCQCPDNMTIGADKATCFGHCPPLVSDLLYLECNTDYKTLKCNKPMSNGTTVQYKCRFGYTEDEQSSMNQSVITCSEGKWSRKLPTCKSACGGPNGNSTPTPLIFNGAETKPTEFPWHAGLYHRDKNNSSLWINVCGGSLISDTLVLTAAHCIPLKPKTTTDLRIALGKRYSSWYYDEGLAIKCNVSKWFVHDHYEGSPTWYDWDIAIVVLSRKVTFSSYIMPVCFNLDLPTLFTDNEPGYVVGFNRMSPSGNINETLHQLEVNITSREKCRSLKDFPIQSLSADKLCGVLNPYSSFQNGDSGGGLTVLHLGRHNLQGILSVKINSVTKALFSNITWDFNKYWIRRVFNENKLGVNL